MEVAKTKYNQEGKIILWPVAALTPASCGIKDTIILSPG
jgi:hypothetical protein